MRHKIQFLSIAITCLIICSCATRPSAYSSNLLSAQTYLESAELAGDDEKSQHLLGAAQRFMLDRQLPQAKKTLSQIRPETLTPELQMRYALLRAEYKLLTHQSRSAIHLLTQIDATKLSPTANIMRIDLLARAYQNSGMLLAALTERDQLIPLLQSTEAQQRNLAAIWQALQTEKIAKLHLLLAQTGNEQLRGWLSFALLTAQPGIHGPLLLQQIQQWQQHYPNHPANELLTNKLSPDNLLLPTNPQHIALILPLSGHLATTGKAIRNGFLAAYYQEKKRQHLQPKISIIDSNKDGAVAAYQQAIAKQADFVVGPLTKQHISDLAESHIIDRPTLTLNRLTTGQVNFQRFFQFGLSPLQEAIQVANKARHDNHSRTLVIYPDTAWGHEVADTFKSQWQDNGGRIISELGFKRQGNLTKQIRKLLNIDQSQQRARSLMHLLGKKTKFIQHRRHDIDMIFLIADPEDARQIAPLLRFYYAGNVPIYGTSNIFSGVVNRDKDRDLDGIIFCGMPWTIQPRVSLPNNLYLIHNQLMNLWKNQFVRHSKLYALGVDAYRIIYELNKLALLPQFGIVSATGRLYLQHNYHIYRRLLWAQIRYGTPQLLNATT